MAKVGAPIKVCDGGGLWLVVTSPTASSWVFRYQFQGINRQAGLGKYADVSLADARGLAADMRRQKALGNDPLSERHRRTSQAMTFKACAESYIKSQAPGWRNATTELRWRALLRDNAYPLFGNLAVGAVDTPLVLKAVDGVWRRAPEAGRRLRLQIERILDFASAHNYRSGDNPASMTILRNLLPSQTNIVKHHPALPAAEVAGFLRDLSRQEGVAAKALALTILTAVRTGEMLGGTWSEIDLPGRVWTVPGSHTKQAREHKVPLSSAAVAVLEASKPAGVVQPGDYIFKGAKPGKPLSSMSMVATLRRMGRDDITVHGFRSTFRSWCAEGGYPREVAEAALAHTVGNRVEQAYNRSTLFDQRRGVMDAWGAYCVEGEQIAPAARSLA